LESDYNDIRTYLKAYKIRIKFILIYHILFLTKWVKYIVPDEQRRWRICPCGDLRGAAEGRTKS